MNKRLAMSMTVILLLFGLNQCGQKGGLERPQAERFALTTVIVAAG